MQIKQPFYELIEYIEIRVQRIAIPYYSPNASKFWGEVLLLEFLGKMF